MGNSFPLEDIKGVIFRIEGYFEPEDVTHRVRIDIFDGEKRLSILGCVDEFESLISIINEELEKIGNREYLR